jgi:hypothetical protein
MKKLFVHLLVINVFCFFLGMAILILALLTIGNREFTVTLLLYPLIKIRSTTKVISDSTVSRLFSVVGFF